MNAMKSKKKFHIYNHLFIQLCVCFSAVLILFALIIGESFLRRYEKSIVDNYQKQLKNQAKHIAKEMSNFIQDDDVEGSFAYQEFLESMENSENTDIWLIDNSDHDKELKKEYTNADITDLELSNNVKRVIQQAKNGVIAYAAGYDVIYEKTMMCVAAPMTDQRDEVVGIVLLNSFVEQRDKMIQNSRTYIMYSIIAGIILSLTLGFVLASIITKPLTKMRQVTMELAAGDYEKRTNLRAWNEIGFLAQGMDMLAERLEKNEKERKDIEQARMDFFANVSHELRTPITVMRGYSESLADGVVKEEKKQGYYQRMVSECQSMDRLVGDLLTLSKIQNPMFEMEKEPVNLVQVFQDILRVYKTTDFGKSMQFYFSCEREVILMPGDYDRLRQVFLNIMNNAIKFSPEQGNVWVSIQVTDEIVVSIRDEGVGISKEEIPFIFEKFYKSKLRQNAKGSGLGLMIAKHIVEKHDGTIQVESGLGEGTEFRILFPFIKEETILEEYQ